jgi:branched-chain amino acid aminotransferase
MSTPERPPFIWFNGQVCPWEQAQVHVWSELAVRGASVFEGVRCYRRADGTFHLLSWMPHLRRLFESARTLRIPVPYEASTWLDGIADLLQALGSREHVYVRPTIYIESGRYGLDPSEVKVGAYIVAVPVPRGDQALAGIRCCVSSWQRVSALAFPPRVKAGAAYQMFRLPMLEARERGCDEAILLNSQGHVAEATGASVFVVRDGVVATPPLGAGILASITRQNLIALLRGVLDVPIVEREIDRDELYVADEVFLAGTLAEVLPVLAVDGMVLGGGSVGALTARVRDAYADICLGHRADSYEWLQRVGSVVSRERCQEKA